MTDDWNANDYSNIVTVGAAALCSILMVLFKSRCTQISLLWGIWKCNRIPQDSSDEEPQPEPEPEPQPEPEPEPQPEPNNP